MPVDTAVAEYNTLGPAEKAQFKQQIALPPPPGSGLTAVWVLLLLILGVVVIGGGWLVYQLIVDEQDTSVLVGFVSAALGALIGLLAPSPVGGNTGGGS